MALRLDLPTAARRLPLDHPDHAIAEFVALVADLKDGGEGTLASLEPRITEVVESVLASGATYLAVLTSDTAAPAVLTAAPVAGPAQGQADVLRDAVENVGGPDVRETATVDTAVGPVVVAQRVPGVEQKRAGRPLTLQLQAFIPEPDTGGMLLLTLASSSAHGWREHQATFGAIVRSARVEATG